MELSDPELHWCLDLLVAHGDLKGFVEEFGGWSDASVASALGLPPAEEFEMDPDQMRRSVSARYREVRAHRNNLELPDELAINLAKLAELIGLDETEQLILAFTVILHGGSTLTALASQGRDHSSASLYTTLSGLLQMPINEVRRALSPAGLLHTTGLIEVDRDGQYNLIGKLELGIRSFSEKMFEQNIEPVDLFRGKLTTAPSGRLASDDFSHIDEVHTLVKAVVADAKRRQRQGVNVLLYGAPGTGKTELSRLVASEVGLEAFEVAIESKDGDPEDGRHRLRAWRAGQAVLGSRPALLIFDEAEDIFASHQLFSSSLAQRMKGWVNRALETNPVPTLWLSNSISSLDPAFVRRFDLLLEVRQPTHDQRRRMAQQMLGDRVDDALLDRVAATDSLSPAVLQRAASVAHRISMPASHSPEMQPAGTTTDTLLGDENRLIQIMLDNTLKAQGAKGLNMEPALGLAGRYRPELVNTTSDLSQVANGIATTNDARLCLYGPPGTGKSAFGHWLAEKLDRRLILKRASDLLGPYVGMTEQNMAEAFREAEEAGAILLIDEIDSFLADRAGATQQWQATMVNEMLTQMERFQGVFIATTNRMNGLDPATMRRFDLKLEFDYLDHAQRERLLRETARNLGATRGIQKARGELHDLHNLTPGDFAAVSRRHRFEPFATAEELVSALRDESRHKPDGRERRIGF
ncbi:AAA family ATPase [Guyparkeria hydrothermalis]|uniref:AAA family ATPase n=1 Tax=Guyparkeria hydrothermalis TaxID=923 RepID=UPI0020218968|nr:AAA family ATPase [Guyparkeria hydrothermalis]MCL7744266.1 AAA family ATPase [Guyparkeria hydrothermalis]